MGDEFVAKYEKIYAYNLYYRQPWLDEEMIDEESIKMLLDDRKKYDELIKDIENLNDIQNSITLAFRVPKYLKTKHNPIVYELLNPTRLTNETIGKLKRMRNKDTLEMIFVKVIIYLAEATDHLYDGELNLSLFSWLLQIVKLYKEIVKNMQYTHYITNHLDIDLWLKAVN